MYYFFIEPNGELTLTNSGFTRVKGTASENSYKGILIIPSEVTLPAGNPYNGQEETFKVTTIGTRAAYHCVGDAPDYPEKKRSEYDAYLQNVDGTNELISVIIPPTVKEIKDAAFSDGFALSRVIGLDNVEKIGDLAFCKTAIQTLNFSDKLKVMGEQIFWYCVYLTDITIPKSVTSMGKQEFAYSDNLKSIYIETKFTDKILTNLLDKVDVSKVTIYVHPDNYNDYKGWADSYNAKQKDEKKKITLTKEVPNIITGKWHYNYSEINNTAIPDTIIIKEGGSICVDNVTKRDSSYNDDYSRLKNALKGKTIKIEKNLPVGEYSLVGNIGGATSYSTDDFKGLADLNEGNNTKEAHGIIALPFYYIGNNWGVNANGLGATTQTPVSCGESFFIYPTGYRNGYPDKTIKADTYTILTGSITSPQFNDITANNITNNNTTKWFALSNPFIGELNLNKFFTTNSTALQSTVAYVWDNKVTHDWEELDITGSTYAILPATGFMVEGINANPTFNFNVSDIVTNDDLDMIDITKATPANKIEFVVRSKGIKKRMYAHINDVSSNGFGRMDASVLFSSKENAVNPYMKVEGHNLLDNYFSVLPATFDLNFNAYKDNTISFALTETMQDIEITLIDIANDNAETVLNIDEPISIGVTAGQNEGRYKLRFAKKNVGINEVAGEESVINIWNNSSEVNISGKELKKVEIYNTLGQVVYSKKLNANNATLETNLNSGAYIVKVSDSKTSKSEKIIIK